MDFGKSDNDKLLLSDDLWERLESSVDGPFQRRCNDEINAFGMGESLAEMSALLLAIRSEQRIPKLMVCNVEVMVAVELVRMNNSSGRHTRRSSIIPLGMADKMDGGSHSVEGWLERMERIGEKIEEGDKVRAVLLAEDEDGKDESNNEAKG